MKKIHFTSIVLFVSTLVFGQLKLEKLWESDSVTLNGPESVLFDAKTNSLYVSSMNAGTVVRMDLNGKIIKKDWVTGLNSNKGSALYKDMYYTAEQTGVAVIDVKKASIIKRIPVEGAIMLNDLAIDSKGTIYVSDTRAAKVYKIDGDTPSLYLENMPGANGLLPIKTDLYVLTSTAVQKVDSSRAITKIADNFESGLDGIVMTAEDEFIISDYHGIIYIVKSDGTKQVLLDSRADKIMSNDISFDSKKRILYVPSFNSNRIIAYEVK